jgi:hypothetical protein
LAAVIHEADVDDDRFHTPEATGLAAVIRRLGLISANDSELFSITDGVFEGLHALFGRTLS